MGDSRRRPWIGGTVFLALVIAAASWFLAISPTLATAAETRAEAQATRDQNDLLELRIAKLRADFERLPEFRAELEAIQTQIPTDADLASYLRQLDEAATSRAVTLTSVSPSPPVAVVPAVPIAPAVPAPAPADSAVPPAEGGDSPTAAAVVPAAPAGPVAPEGFVTIPVSMTVVGTYQGVVRFLDDTQNGTDRLLLVAGLQATALQAAEAGGGRPATAAGDLELIITGFAYVLVDPAATSATAPADEQPLPGPVHGRNPLSPSS